MLASNKPKMPTLYRIRNDITWETVVQNWSERVIVPNGIYPIYIYILLKSLKQVPIY